IMSEKAIQPPKPKKLKTEDCEEKKKFLVVVIEGASLEAAKVGNDYVILSSEKHATFLNKHRKDPADYRPDILHQCLLNLLDSPLNRAGLLQVYVHTAANVLIEISPQCRLPRTFDRFCGLMVQLLYKLVIRSADSSQKLLRVIKNPINNHLPVGCRKILSSFMAEKLTLPSKLVDPESNDPVVVVIGGIARGKIETDYTDEEVKVSSYPLSAALTCAKITSGFEEAWGIL
ncbi:hypothetical protein PFISCL1PPCAC_12364, partial [Pristionchus fissidentatus]